MNRLGRNWQKLRARLAHKYRLILVDDATYQQTGYYNFTLGRMLAIIVIGAAVVLLCTTVLIVFTPIREWIPGYTDPRLQRQQKELLSKLATMEALVAKQDTFIKNIQRVSGYTPADSAQIKEEKTKDKQANPQKKPTAYHPQAHSVSVIPAVYLSQVPVLRVQLRWPVDGVVTNPFSERLQHYGIDLAAPKDAIVQAVADGYVILAEYSVQTGYIIGLQHADGLVTFYKHNSHLFKKVGSFVFAGEAIAVVGNSGEQSTGPHLHFELWQNGRPLDPIRYFVRVN